MDRHRRSRSSANRETRHARLLPPLSPTAAQPAGQNGQRPRSDASPPDSSAGTPESRATRVVVVYAASISAYAATCAGLPSSAGELPVGAPTSWSYPATRGTVYRSIFDGRRGLIGRCQQRVSASHARQRTRTLDIARGLSCTTDVQHDEHLRARTSAHDRAARRHRIASRPS